MYLLFSFLFRYIVLVHKVLWPFIDIYCTYLFHSWLMYVFSFTYPFMCCFFSPFIYMFLINCMQSINFCLTQRCLDKFCLKCFGNTGCQSLLVINSLLAKIFKILWYDRFYCIQQVNMSKVIYDFSHMLICLLWFYHRLPNGEIVRTYVFHMLESYVTILCNWLILWQNTLYL